MSKILELQLQHQSFQWIFSEYWSQWIFSEYWFQWIFNEYWFPLGLTGLISLRFKGLSRVSSNSTNQKHLIHKEKKRKKKASNPWHSASFMVELSHLYMTTWKTIALTIWTSVSQVMSLLFNMLSKFVIAFLPRSKWFLISWLQSLSAVILKPKKVKFVTVSTFSPSICHEIMGPDAVIFVFECRVLS